MIRKYCGFALLIYCRNFLLFIPANTPSLRAVLSYYSSTMKVNAEGDVHVSDETVQGLGTHRFPTTLFGALAAIAKPPPSRLPPKLHQSTTDERMATHTGIASQPGTFPWNPGDQFLAAPETLEKALLVEGTPESRMTGVLTDLFPSTGYFVAGGAAGVVSRTATAPLDRLKVYLIAQTGVRDEAVQIAKSEAPVQAAKKATRPLIKAAKSIWRMGGTRSLFAGGYVTHNSRGL